MRLFRKKAEVSPEIAKMRAFTKILMKLEIPKLLIRFGVNFFAEHIVSDAIKLKKKHGFNNAEMQILHEVMTDVIQKNEKAWTLPNMPAYNKDRRLWTNLRDVSLLIADSDTYYTLRVWYLLDRLFERQEDFKIKEKKEESWLWNYEEFTKAKEFAQKWEDKKKELQMQAFEKIIGENDVKRI